MNISIFGLGYVGAVSLACLARDGHRIIGVDVDPAKLEQVGSGRTPVVEEGMVDLMAHVAATGRVTVTADVSAAIRQTDISFVCVGTPSAPNGSQDQSAVVRLARELGSALREKNGVHVIVFRSTLVPGTVEEVLKPIIERESGKRDSQDFHLCFQPEFLREGSSIHDYDHPPVTIVGTNAAAASTVLRRLFGHLAEFCVTSIRTAEMVKYCANNFHALKVTFANETARLCEALEVNPFEVMDLMCRDTHLTISRAYMKPGFAFGGSCLPKDLRATMHMARMRDVQLPMLDGVLNSNRLHIEHALTKILASGCRRIGLVGLSFKTGTDDLRESPLVLLAERLIGKGLGVLVYDPSVQTSRLLGANRRFIEEHLPHIGAQLRPDLERVIAASDLLVVGLNDRTAFEVITRQATASQTVIDLVGMPRRDDLKAEYVGLCWESGKPRAVVA